MLEVDSVHFHYNSAVLLPNNEALLHVSEIAHERVEKVSDHLQEGQVVKVKVLETDEKGRIKLSMKALTDRPPREDRGDRPPREDRGDRAPREDRGDRPPRAPRDEQRMPADAPAEPETAAAQQQQQQQ